MSNTNTIKIFKNLSTDSTYNEMYGLNRICIEEVVMDNIFNFLRLRDSLVEVYNYHEMSKQLKSLWIQNILIITASIIEALLQQAFLRFKYICDNRSADCPICSSKKTIDELDTKRTTFSNLILLAEKYEMLYFENKLVEDLRKLRNNIHISNSNFNLNSDKRLDYSYANFAFEVLDHTVVSLHSFFQYVNNECL
jgi:hypothetical protein